MNYLLDTNVLSEVTKPRPDAQVLTWLSSRISSSLFVSVVSIAEIRKGVLMLPAGRKRQSLEQWLENDLCSAFSGRILPLGEEEMMAWSFLQADGEKRGLRMPAMDSLIAATARCHALAIVTRNTGDFKNCQIHTVNPWQENP